MKQYVLTILTFIAFTNFSKAQNKQPFKEGDRVAFVRSSITEAGLYEAYIWQYYLSHFPDHRIKIMNVGIGGDVAKLIDARFKDDVLARDPNVIVLTYGMNDTGYFEYNSWISLHYCCHE